MRNTNTQSSDRESTASFSSAERAAFLQLYSELKITGPALLTHYGVNIISLPPLIDRIARLGEKTGINTIKALSIPFIIEKGDKLKVFLEECGDQYAAPLMVVLDTRVTEEWRKYFDYLQQLDAQGGSTTNRTFVRSPLGWVPNHQDALLKIRSSFGVVSEQIFKAIKEHYPNDCPEEIRNLIDSDQIWSLGLLVKEGKNAWKCAQLYSDTLKSLQRLCDDIGRRDAFLAATVYLSEPLLSQHGDNLIQLAQIRPDKLPDILRNLSIDMLVKFDEVLSDICRHAVNRIAPAIDVLPLVSIDEKPLASTAIRSSGIFAYKALAMRGGSLFKKDPEKHLKNIEFYGPAYWGLAEKFGDSLPSNLKTHSKFIDEAMALTGIGAGKFFSELPTNSWNKKGLAIANRYRCASGYILELWKKASPWPERAQKFRKLVDFNREMFGLTWINRFIKVEAGVINDHLLKANKDNCYAPFDNRATALYIGSAADPMNSLASPTTFRILAEMNKRLRLFMSEANSRNAPLNLMQRICTDQRYGASSDRQRLIDVLLLASHSDGYALQVQGTRHIPGSDASAKTRHPDYFLTSEDEDIFQKWGEFLSPNALVILYACSTLKSSNSPPSIGYVIKRALQKSTPNVRVVGLTKPGDLKDFKLDDRGIPTKISWRDGYCWF